MKIDQMTTLLICILNICFALEPFQAQNIDDEQEFGIQKIKELLQLQEDAEDNIIRFSKESYTKYILTQPRPYIVVNLFTVQNQDCMPCKEMENELKQVVYSYQEVLMDLDLEVRPLTDVPVFYGIVDYSSQDVSELFKLHQFQSVPHLYLSFPDSLKKKKGVIKIPKEDMFEGGMYGDIYAQKMLE